MTKALAKAGISPGVEGAALPTGITQQHGLRFLPLPPPLLLHAGLPGAQCGSGCAATPCIHGLHSEILVCGKNTRVTDCTTGHVFAHTAEPSDRSWCKEVALGEGMHCCANHLGKQLVPVPPSGDIVAPSQEAAVRCVAAPKGHCNPFGLHGAPHDAAIVRSSCRLKSLLVSVSDTSFRLNASRDRSGSKGIADGVCACC